MIVQILQKTFRKDCRDETKLDEVHTNARRRASQKQESFFDD